MHALRDRIRSSPRFARYPAYSCLLATTLLVADRLPMSREAFEVLREQPVLPWLYRSAGIGAILLAIALGLVGLARPGRSDQLLSLAGLGVAGWLAPGFILHFQPLLWIELAGFLVILFLWHVPASIFHDLSGGNPAIILPLWIFYLLGLYFGLRIVTLRIWRVQRPRLEACWAWMRSRGRAGWIAAKG